MPPEGRGTEDVEDAAEIDPREDGPRDEGPSDEVRREEDSRDAEDFSSPVGNAFGTSCVACVGSSAALLATVVQNSVDIGSI